MSEESSAPQEYLDVNMYHLGDGVKVRATYNKPRVKDLKELNQTLTVTDLLVKHCEVLVYIDGKRQPMEWWDDLPEDIYIELAMFMESHRPKKPEKAGAISSLPLVWKQ